MATVTITIPDALVPRLRAAIRDKYPQYAKLSDSAAFKAATGDYWRKELATYEREVAHAEAVMAAQAAVDAAYVGALDDAAGIG
jgi:hypothetical protein